MAFIISVRYCVTCEIFVVFNNFGIIMIAVIHYLFSCCCYHLIAQLVIVIRTMCGIFIYGEHWSWRDKSVDVTANKSTNVAVYSVIHDKTPVSHLNHQGRVTHILFNELNRHISHVRSIIRTDLGSSLIVTLGANFSKTEKKNHKRQLVTKCNLENGGHFVSALM